MAYDKVVDSTVLDNGLTAIAGAVRTKGGTSASLAFPTGIVNAINALPSGGSTLTKRFEGTVSFTYRAVQDISFNWKCSIDCAWSNKSFTGAFDPTKQYIVKVSNNNVAVKHVDFVSLVTRPAVDAAGFFYFSLNSYIQLHDTSGSLYGRCELILGTITNANSTPTMNDVANNNITGEQVRMQNFDGKSMKVEIYEVSDAGTPCVVVT